MPRVYKNSSRSPKIGFWKAVKSFVLHRIAVRRQSPDKLQHVIDLVQNLNGTYPLKSYTRLKATNFGHEVLNGENSLSKMVADHDRLKSLDPNTLGGLYYKLNTEGIDVFKTLSSQMRTDEYTEEYTSFLRRELDVHDMIHIVMEFDRTILSEACVVVAASKGGGSPYVKWFFIVPTIMTRLSEFSSFKRFLEALKIIFWETPKRCSSIDDWHLIHWESMLDMDIHEVRQKLNIPASTLYKPDFFRVSEERT